MRSLRSTLVLIVILGGLVGYIYYLNKGESSPTETKEKAFASLKSEDIEEVQIKAADGQTSRVLKADGAWRITSPEEAPADQGELSSITSSLATLDIQRVVDENTGDLKQYGLEPAKIEVEFRAKGDKEPRKLQLGEKTPTGGDLYARFPTQKRVFLVSSFLDSTFNKNAFALRDKTIIKIDREKVDRIEIVADKRSVTLAKTGTEWQIVAPLMARADFAAVEGALERLSSAQMQGIVPADKASDLKTLKLEPPVATFTATSGSARATLQFGNTENALIYAKDSARPMVFTVAPTLYTDLIRDLAEFRRKDLFDARSFTATHVEFKRGTETVTLNKTKNKDGSEEWKNGDKLIHAMKVEDLLSKVSSLRAESFESAVNAALKSPALVVTIRFDENKMEQVTFAKAGTDVVASRMGEPGTAKLMASSFDEVFKGIDEMK